MAKVRPSCRTPLVRSCTPGQDKVDRFVMSNEWAYKLGYAAAVVSTYYIGGYGGAMYQSYYSYVATGSRTEALKVGMVAAAKQFAMNYYTTGSGLEMPSSGGVLSAAPNASVSTGDSALFRLFLSSYSRAPNSPLVLAFDGAGGENTGDNSAFRSLARRHGAVLYDESAFSGHANGRPAIELAIAFSKANPGSSIFILGYSAGGDEAIYVANQLGARGLKVSGLVTFDPHIDSFFGIKDYKLSSNVNRAVNFRQSNAIAFGPNTFRGGYVDGALNVILSDSNHISIVSDALRFNTPLVDAVLSD